MLVLNKNIAFILFLIILIAILKFGSNNLETCQANLVADENFQCTEGNTTLYRTSGKFLTT